MPIVPKKNPRTGSVLLGQELRRLRGTRTLKEVCDLTRSPALSGHVAPIAMATLSEIESGKALPQLATLHALSVVYKTSMSQLMAYVTEEKLAKEVGEIEGASEEELYEKYSRLVADRHWTQALAVSLIAERLSTSDNGVVAWRANRANCLAQLRMFDEAISLLGDCCESPAASLELRLRMVFNLAVAHATAGNLWQASVYLQQAESMSVTVPQDAELRGLLSVMQAETVIERHKHGLPVSERELRDALRRFEAAIAATPPENQVRSIRLHLELAATHAALGNLLVASRDARQGLEAAQKLGSNSVIGFAHYLCAEIAVAAGDQRAAVEHYSASLAPNEVDGQHDFVFQACFRLFQLLREERPGRATQFLRRCDELAPLVTARTPLWREYTAVSRARS